MNFTRLILLASIVLGSACPTYEDEFSGTYLEDTTLATFSGEARSIELFRFGDNVQGLVRYYQRGADPFERESRCVWTKSAPFSEDGFTLPLVSSRERTDIRGTFKSDDTIAFSFSSATNENSAKTPFIRKSETPSKECVTIDDTLVSANFDFDGNRFDPDVFEFTNPVFVLMWLGVNVIQQDTLFTFAKTQRKGPWVRIAKSHATPDKRGLEGVLHFFLPPPDESVLTVSGETRYSIGHPIVVEDEKGDDGNFTLEIDSERIIASAIQKGVRPNISPEGTNYFGKAVLFVEGDLDDLAPALQRQFKNTAKIEMDQHFYIVEIYSRNDDIKEIRFDPTNDVELNILITETYLNQNELKLPRLVPLRL